MKNSPYKRSEAYGFAIGIREEIYTMNMNTTKKRKRFTVGNQKGTQGDTLYPSLQLWGKWLSEFGIATGDTLEVIDGKNMLVLVKVPKVTIVEDRGSGQLRLAL